MAQEIVEKPGVSRRSFLKGAGAVVGFAVVGLPSFQKALAQAIPPSATLPKDTLLEMYRRMQRIRQSAARIDKLMTNKTYPQLVRSMSSTGEEATCIGVAFAMQDGDQLTSSHRSYGYPIARGMPLNSVMAELMGKVGGSNRGHAGSMHISDHSIGVLTSCGITATETPIALGAAWSFKLQAKNQVAITACGDGAVNSAGFNSSLNLAAIKNLPVVFVINNNHWQVSMRAEWVHSLLKASQNLSARAAGFAIPGITVDGNDLFAVYTATKYCIDQARQGNGPSLLECDCYRTGNHAGGAAHEVLAWPWKNPGELAYWRSPAQDPINRFENTTLTMGSLAQADLDAVRTAVATEVDDAEKFAVASAEPDPVEEFKYLQQTFNV